MASRYFMYLYYIILMYGSIKWANNKFESVDVNPSGGEIISECNTGS